MMNLNDELREPVKKFCEIKISWEDISTEKVDALWSVTEEITNLEPKLSKDEALALLSNIGPTHLDGLASSIIDSVYESRDWPIEEVLYINMPSDPLSEFKLECLGLGLTYRFRSENNSSLIVNLENYIKKYMELVPPLNIVDLRFIIATLGNTWEADLPGDFVAHMRYLYENTPAFKDLGVSNFSDGEKYWLYRCFQDARFDTTIYPVHFKLKSPDGIIILESNLKNVSARSRLEISFRKPDEDGFIPECDDYVIRAKPNTEIDIFFNPYLEEMEGYDQTWDPIVLKGYNQIKTLDKLGYTQIGGELYLESDDGVFAIAPSGNTSAGIRFTADASSPGRPSSHRHILRTWVNSDIPEKVNKIVFRIGAQIIEL